MIKVYIDSIKLFEQNKETSVHLNLPADKATIEKAFEVAEIQGPQDCEMFDASCDIPQINRMLDSFDLSQNSIHELNLFALKLHGLNEPMLERFKAALILRTPDTLKDAINLTANLNQINVLPDIWNEKELGDHLIDIGVYDFEAKALPYLDYAGIGTEYLAEHTALLTELGFIEDYRQEHQRTVLYDGVNLPGSYKSDMGIDLNEPVQQEQSM